MESKQNILVLVQVDFGKNLREYFDNHKSDNEIIFNGKKDIDLMKISFQTTSVMLSRYSINCTAFVGGISYGPKYPAKLLHDNSKMIGYL